MRPLLALGTLLTALALLAPTVGAGHISRVDVFSTPVGANTVRFDYVLLGTGAPGGGGLHVDLGNGHWVCILAPLDVFQPAGVYPAELRMGPCNVAPILAMIPYTMAHPAGGALFEAQATFHYTYAAPGTYAGAWWTCCDATGAPHTGTLSIVAV